MKLILTKKIFDLDFFDRDIFFIILRERVTKLQVTETV